MTGCALTENETLLTTRFEAIHKANNRAVLLRTFNKSLALLLFVAADSETVSFHHVRHGAVLHCATDSHTILNGINQSFIGEVPCSKTTNEISIPVDVPKFAGGVCDG